MKNFAPNPWLYLPLLLLPLAHTAAWAVGETTRVSVSSSGEQAHGYYSYGPSFSADGRYVAFYSDGFNLVEGDNNGSAGDIFVHDRQTGETKRVSVSSSGEQGHRTSRKPSLSADGRYVAFESDAWNLVAGDNNFYSDIFVHDRQTGKTTRVSVASGGEQANHPSYSPSLSADGRYVAFQSDASNLVAGDTRKQIDIFVHDRQTGKTTRASVASDGGQADRWSESPSLSADGRYVAFESDAWNLVAGDTNSNRDIFVHDRQTGKTTRVSVASNGGQVNGDSWSPNLSADGRYVAFSSWAPDLVAGDINLVDDIFVHDRQTGKTTRASVASNGRQANSDSTVPSLSADGRYVVFHSDASNLVAGDTNNTYDTFVHDRQTGETTRVSVSSSGGKTNASSVRFDPPSISADGRYVAFSSMASNLVAGDTNRWADLFVRDRNLDTRYPADPQITVTAKPGALPVNSQGRFRYTITNNGPTATNTRLVHSVSNGKVVRFNHSQGRCDRYATLSLCNFGVLKPNASMTLEMQVKATDNPLRQLLSVSPSAREDVAPDNNSVTVNTKVTPAQ